MNNIVLLVWMHHFSSRVVGPCSTAPASQLFRKKKKKGDAKSGWASWAHNYNVMSLYHKLAGAAGEGIGKRLESDCTDEEQH